MAIESAPTTQDIEKIETSEVAVDIAKAKSDLADTAMRAQMLIEVTKPTNPSEVFFDGSGVRLTARDMQEVRENGPQADR